MTHLSSAYTEFLLACEADGLSKATIVWYTSILGMFIEANGQGLVAEFSTHQIRAYVANLPGDYSQETKKGHRRALHKFWAWCASEYQIKNPMANMSYPAAPKPNPQPARIEDVQALFAHAGEGLYGVRNRAIMALLLDTGCRRAEIAGLRMADVDWERRRMLVTGKGNKTRGTPFSSHTMLIIDEWLKARMDVPSLFYDPDTLEPLKPNGLGQMLKRIARRIGVTGRISAHRWRDLFATEYIKAGGDLVTLAKLMGHKSVNTTADHYVGFTSDEIAAAHEKYSPIRNLVKVSDEH